MRVGILIPFYEEASRYAGGNTERSDDQRENTALQLIECDTQRDRRDEGADIGLEQVGAHSCDVTDVVTDVIRDRRGISGVVFRDTGLDLTYEVRADVSSFRVDTAADTREQGDRGRAERKAGQDIRISGDQINGAGAEKAEADDAHSHDRAARKCHRKRGVHSVVLGRGRRAHVRPGRDIHPDVSGRRRERGADQETYCGSPADAGSDEHKKDRHKEDQDPVLCHQERACALMNERRDLFHPVRTGVIRQHFPDQSVGESERAQCERYRNY